MRLLFGNKERQLVIEAFAEAEWGQERPSHKLIIGNGGKCCSTPVTWGLKKQKVGALSSKVG